MRRLQFVLRVRRERENSDSPRFMVLKSISVLPGLCRQTLNSSEGQALRVKATPPAGQVASWCQAEPGMYSDIPAYSACVRRNVGSIGVFQTPGFGSLWETKPSVGSHTNEDFTAFARARHTSRRALSCSIRSNRRPLRLMALGWADSAPHRGLLVTAEDALVLIRLSIASTGRISSAELEFWTEPTLGTMRVILAYTQIFMHGDRECRNFSNLSSIGERSLLRT